MWLHAQQGLVVREAGGSADDAYVHGYTSGPYLIASFTFGFIHVQPTVHIILIVNIGRLLPAVQ